MISFIQSCSIDTTAYFSISIIIIIKVYKNNFKIINLSQCDASQIKKHPFSYIHASSVINNHTTCSRYSFDEFFIQF